VAVHIGDGEIDVRANLSGVQDDVDKGIKKSLASAEDDFDKSGKKSGSAFSGAFAGILTGGALLGATKFLGDSLAEAVDAKQISAVISNAINQAGSAARGLTKNAFDDVAQQIADSLVVDNDDIAKGLAPLLRIPDLTKPAFDQLAKVAADTATGTGKDLEAVTAALSRLATAPEDAIGALRGLGVQVTDETKDAVKGLVEQGDTAGALNLILDQLRDRYGGAAKAAGDAVGPQQRLDTKMKDLKESIGTALLPVIAKLTDFLIPIFNAFTNLPGPVQAIIVALVGLAAAAAVLAPIFTAISAAIPVIGGVLAALVSPVALVVAAIVGLGIVIFVFRDDIWGALKAVAGFFADAFGAVVDFVQKWGFILLGPIGVIFHFRDEIGNAISAVIGFVARLPGDIAGFIGEAVQYFLDLPGRILSAVGDLGGLLFDVGRDIVDGLIDGIKSLGGAIVDALLGLIPGPLKRFANRLGIGSPSKVFAGFGRNIGQGLIVGMDSMHRPVSDAAGALAGASLTPTTSVSHSQSVTVNALGAGQDDLVEMIARRVSLRLGMAAGL
jgi:uncharacterized protein YidB (DUF937 family)